MNRMIVTGACALFLVACSGNGTSADPTGPATAASVQTDAKAVFELGRPI